MKWINQFKINKQKEILKAADALYPIEYTEYNISHIRDFHYFDYHNLLLHDQCPRFIQHSDSVFYDTLLSSFWKFDLTNTWNWYYAKKVLFIPSKEDLLLINQSVPLIPKVSWRLPSLVELASLGSEMRYGKQLFFLKEVKVWSFNRIKNHNKNAFLLDFSLDHIYACKGYIHCPRICILPLRTNRSCKV